MAHIIISTRGHTAVASKTSMSERQSLLGLGSKAKQIVVFFLLPQRICSRHNVCNIHVADSITYRCWPQYSLKIRSEAKYNIGGLFTFNPRSFIPEVDEKITERKEKWSNI